MTKMPLLDIAFYILFALITLSLTLYFTVLMKLKPSIEVKLSTYLEKPKEKRPIKNKRKIQQSINSSVTTTPTDDKPKKRQCPHYIGYLTTLPKGSSFPEECFGCRRVVKCMGIEPSEVIESFYADAPETE